MASWVGLCQRKRPKFPCLQYKGLPKTSQYHKFAHIWYVTFKYYNHMLNIVTDLVKPQGMNS